VVQNDVLAPELDGDPPKAAAKDLQGLLTVDAEMHLEALGRDRLDVGCFFGRWLAVSVWAARQLSSDIGFLTW
jgi:hypothetical protein